MAPPARLPSPGALFMFEAAARHRNFTLAAREFNVTQSAISRMISRLEDRLGARLFLRRSMGLELTEQGRALQRAVRQGFDRIEEAVCDIQASANAGDVVTLSVTSAFAIHLLMPRFDKFRREVPGVQIRLDLIHGEPHGLLGARISAFATHSPMATKSRPGRSWERSSFRSAVPAICGRMGRSTARAD